MAARKTEIVDSNVRFMYEVEGKTQQEIADYYGVSRSCIYFRLHPYFKTDNGKASVKKYQQSNKGKVTKKRAAKKYSITDKGKEAQKRWRVSDKGKDARRIFWRTERGKLLSRKIDASRRNLGYIELNNPFPNSEGHHISTEYIIHIPVDLHHSIPHNVWTGEGMVAINIIAFRYITEEVFDKLISGEI